MRMETMSWYRCYLIWLLRIFSRLLDYVAPCGRRAGHDNSDRRCPDQGLMARHFSVGWLPVALRLRRQVVAIVRANHNLADLWFSFLVDRRVAG